MMSFFLIFQSIYRQERNNIARNDHGQLIIDNNDDNEFSYLRSIVQVYNILIFIIIIY